MAKPTTACQDAEHLGRYLKEQLPEHEERATEEHINQCEHCQQQLEALAGQQSLWTGLKDHLAEGEPDETVELSPVSRLMEWLAPTDDPDMLGRIGSYEVCAVIGQGSTAVVFKAFEPRLNRFVSIKVLAPTFAANGSARKRFAREARAVAAVLHENVIPIYAVDEQNGIPYIVMQYIPGMSLLQRIKKEGPLNTCEVARIGLQVARGLAAAHDQGIVHRDVKPANVIVENSVDRALVTDFGLARVADEGAMTRTGTIAGTPQYMSPEQAQGESIDHRSDLFSLGSLMYAACTGRPPFRAETIFGVINRVCTQQPASIHESNPEIAPWLISLIQKLMAKEPAQRIQDSHQLARILSREIAHLQDPVNVAKPIRDWQEQPVKPKPETANQPGNAIYWVVAAVLMLAGFGWVANGYFGAVANPEPEPNSMASLISPEEDWVVSDETPSDYPKGTKIAWKRNGDDWGSNLSFDQRVETSFSIKKGDTLKIKLDRGNVVVQPSTLEGKVTAVIMRRVKSGSSEEAEQLIQDHILTFNEETSTIESIYDGPENQTDLFQRSLVRLSVPKNCQLDIQTGEGNVNVGEMDADVSIESEFGDVELARINGQVNVTTMGDIDLEDGATGKVELLATTGNVCAEAIDLKGRIRTSGGHIFLGKSTGSVYAQTSGGNIVVRDVVGKTSAHTCQGDVYVKFSETPGENCSFSATQGNAFVDLYDSVAMDLKMAGEVVTDLETEMLDKEEDDVLQWCRLDRNEGDKLVQVESTTGTVTVKVHETDKGKKSLGGSGGLGGSGSTGSPAAISKYAREKTTGLPRAGAIATVELDSEVMDGYTLYLPESFDEKRKEAYPIIVYLQGAYGVGGKVSDLNKWGLCRLIRDERDLGTERNQLLLDTFIVVSPHIQSGQYHDHPNVVRDMIDTVLLDFNGDPSRVYLTGLSRGGHGTWGLAEKLSDTFAAIIPIAGSPDVIERFRTFKSIPIWIAHNQGDDIEEVETATKKIEKLGGEPFFRIASTEVVGDDYLSQRRILKVPPVYGHDAWTDMYTGAEMYKWLLQQQLESAD